MKTRIKLVHGPAGESAELATVIHNGREYTAYGAVRTDTTIAGYVHRDGATGAYRLRTWGGEDMGIDLLPRGSWPCPRGVFSTRMHAWRAVIDGVTYSGRNGGTNLLLVLRRRIATRES
jgi:hypothetical protein